MSHNTCRLVRQRKTEELEKKNLMRPRGRKGVIYIDSSGGIRCCAKNKLTGWEQNKKRGLHILLGPHANYLDPRGWVANSERARGSVLKRCVGGSYQLRLFREIHQSIHNSIIQFTKPGNRTIPRWATPRNLEKLR